MISQIFKNTHKRVQIYGYQQQVEGCNWMKTVTRYKLPVIRKLSPRDVLYNTTTKKINAVIHESC